MECQLNLRLPRQRLVRPLTLTLFLTALAGVFFIPQSVLTANPLGLLKGDLRKEALTGTDGKRQPATRPATFNQGIDGTEPAVPAAPQLPRRQHRRKIMDFPESDARAAREPPEKGAGIRIHRGHRAARPPALNFRDGLHRGASLRAEGNQREM